MERVTFDFDQIDLLISRIALSTMFWAKTINGRINTLER
jgi:hypothetical protein